jgi:hypothetical protein
MGYQRWIPDALRRFQLKVELEPGWETRGSINFNPQGVVAHHTGSNGDLRVTLRDGRPGLSGPLCNVQFCRDGSCRVIAAGRANHAGKGGYRELSGNGQVLGIEADSDGASWTPAQRELYPTLVAALLSGIGRDESWCCGHKEWAPKRKPDPGNWSMDEMRRRAGERLRKRDVPRKRVPDMVLFWHSGALYVTNGLQRSPHGLPPAQADALKAAGAPVIGDPGKPHPLFDLPVAR